MQMESFAIVRSSLAEYARLADPKPRMEIPAPSGVAPAQWPQLAVQRCINHKLRNLLAKAPARLREELAEDYRRMIYAET